MTALLASVLACGALGCRNEAVCDSGHRQACTCPSGAPSVEICNAVGSGYDPCFCDFDAGPPPGCTSSADLAIVGADAGAITTAATECGHMACFSELLAYRTDPESAFLCVESCLSESAYSSLSPECTRCFVDQGICNVIECAGPCSISPDPVMCDACMATQCAPALQTCMSP